MPHKRKLFAVSKPRLRISSRGVRLIRSRVRIGGRVGINLSSRGVSGSIRTPMGTYNTKRGCFLRLFGCLALASAALWLVQQLHA
jgi:hypothetical protein